MNLGDKCNSEGNELAEKWLEYVKNNPEEACILRETVDDGELRSLPYYHGFHRALIKMAQIDRELLSGENSRSVIFLRMLTYTEYQIRNT